MQEATLIAFTTARPGRRDAVDDWYDTQHVPDLLAVRGVVAAQRFDLRVIKTPEGFPPADFLAFYTLRGDDIDEIYAELGMRMGPDMISEDLDSAKTVAYLAFEKPA